MIQLEGGQGEGLLLKQSHILRKNGLLHYRGHCCCEEETLRALRDLREHLIQPHHQYAVLRGIGGSSGNEACQFQQLNCKKARRMSLPATNQGPPHLNPYRIKMT